MSTFYHIVFGLHMLGLVSLVVGYFLELSRKTFGISPAMLHGASLQVLTGLIMVDLRGMDVYKPQPFEPLNWSIVFVKFAITVGILIACVLGRKVDGDKKKYWAGIGIATLINVGIASLVNG